MTHVQQFQSELEKEASITRKMLSIVPNDKYDWRPHPKSMTIRQLATHIAELPTWVKLVLHTSELDFAANPYQQVPIDDTKALLAYFEKNVADAQQELANTKEEALSETWTLRNGTEIYSSDSKLDVIRMCFNQVTHHRAQLGVYLRLLDVPIPGSYGPSADELGK